MKERFATIGTLVCLTVLTGLTLVFALAIFPGTEAIRWFFATSAMVISRLDAPAWVQAVGSILTIFFAWKGIAWQLRHAEESRIRDKREKDTALTRGCLHVLTDARRALSHTTGKMRRHIAGNHQSFGTERLEEMQHILRSLVAKDLPPRVVPFVLIAQREVAYSMAALRAIGGGRPVTQARANRSQRRLDQLGRAVVAVTLLLRDPHLDQDE